MDRKTLSQFEDALRDRLSEIVPGMKHGISSMMDIRCIQDPMDEVEMSVERSERELMLKIRRRTEELIREIHGALMRIRKGSFGTCVECGRDIEIKRLKAQPMATLCLECKKELEALSRRNVA